MLSEKIDAEESRAVAKETDLLSAIQNVETAVSQTLDSAKDYTDTKLANLVNSAPETLDTLGELATALQENANVVEVLNSSISNKANKSELDTTNTNVTELSDRVTALENKDGVIAVNITSSKIADPVDDSTHSGYTKYTEYDTNLLEPIQQIFANDYKARFCKIERHYLGNAVDIKGGILTKIDINKYRIEPHDKSYILELYKYINWTCKMYHNDTYSLSNEFILYDVYD